MNVQGNLRSLSQTLYCGKQRLLHSEGLGKAMSNQWKVIGLVKVMGLISMQVVIRKMV